MDPIYMAGQQMDYEFKLDRLILDQLRKGPSSASTIADLVIQPKDQVLRGLERMEEKGGVKAHDPKGRNKYGRLWSATKKRNPQTRGEKRKRRDRLDTQAILRSAMRGT